MADRLFDESSELLPDTAGRTLEQEWAQVFDTIAASSTATPIVDNPCGTLAARLRVDTNQINPVGEARLVFSTDAQVRMAQELYG